MFSIPSEKNANITPTFKKRHRVCKDNFSPVSILIVSKKSGKLSSKQIVMYMDKFFSKYQCGFSKGYGQQLFFWQCIKNGSKQWIMEMYLEVL